MTIKTKAKNISTYEKQKRKIKELETQNYQLKMTLADEVEKSKIFAKRNNDLDKRIIEIRDESDRVTLHLRGVVDTEDEIIKELAIEIKSLNTVIVNLKNGMADTINKTIDEKNHFIEDLEHRIKDLIQELNEHEHTDRKLDEIKSFFLILVQKEPNRFQDPVMAVKNILSDNAFLLERNSKLEHVKTELLISENTVKELRKNTDAKSERISVLIEEKNNLLFTNTILNDLIIQAIKTQRN